jgi:hypothetical protein
MLKWNIKKALLAFFIFMHLLNSLSAQNTLQLDQHGKYIYHEIVEKHHSQDSLFQKAQDFAFKYFKEVKTDISTDSATITGAGIFQLNRKSLVSVIPEGYISYKFGMVIKLTKYKFWFTDFTFTPVIRDRFGSYQPVPGIHINLETYGKKTNQRIWKKYITDTYTLSSEMAEKLKQKLYQNLPASNQPKKNISISDWD